MAHEEKPSVKRMSIYVETSVVSYLAAERSRNLVTAAWQQVTWDFWELHRHRYDLYTSEIVVAEASAGEPRAAERRLKLLHGINELSVDDEAKALAAAILSDGVLPAKAELDALHIAVAVVNRLDFLLTWNCRHIDNPVTKPRVRATCARLGYATPEISTPLELTEAQTRER
jgi:predicted nucleic acid-binding protein